MNSLKYLRIILIFFFFSCIISTIFTLFLYFNTVTLKGPNLTGEAGKVYYAHKFQMGENFLSTGKNPPYYPAFHGILLHTSVGAIGKFLGANIEDLYYIGRSITALATLFSLLIIFIICQRFVGDFKWSALSLALFLAPFCVQKFAASYRPDHWILFLSLLSCLICLRRPGAAQFCVLVVLPTLSYLIKAPGIVIGGCIFLSFISNKRYKAALFYAFCSAVFLIITMAFLQWITQGLFASAFLGGMKTGFSVRNTLSSFNYPAIWLPILLAPAIYVYLTRHSEIGKESLRIIFIFWAVETFVALVSAARYGSYVNYFLEGYTYGTILFICWLCTKYQQFANKIILPLWDKIMVFVILIAGSAFIIIPLLYKPSLVIFDDAFLNTLKFGKERHKLADFINKNDLKCYSNDPGLNILFNHPMVIYPHLQNTFFHSGYLDKKLFLDQIRQKKIDVIIFTGQSWSYQGIKNLPEEFMPLIHEFYQPLEIFPDSKYLNFVPK